MKYVLISFSAIAILLLVLSQIYGVVFTRPTGPARREVARCRLKAVWSAYESRGGWGDGASPAFAAMYWGQVLDRSDDLPVYVLKNLNDAGSEVIAYAPLTQDMAAVLTRHGRILVVSSEDVNKSAYAVVREATEDDSGNSSIESKGRR